MNDISNLNVDIVPLADESGRMQVLPMKGWYVGLQYNFSKRVFASATYSQSRLFTEDCYAHFNETQYKKGQYLNTSNTAQTVGVHKPPTPRGLHSTLSVSTRRFFQLMNTIYHFEKKMSRNFC